MAEQDPTFNIQRIYLKDASLEQPNSPTILLEQDKPSIEINLGISAENIAEGVYEVCVTATVHAKVQDKTLFLCECKQGGIFEIRNVPDDQREPLLGVACPQIVYPYLRGNLADLTQRGGFPPVHLAEVNFQSMYEQQKARQQAEAVVPQTVQ